jgi:ribosomal 30S subunit maturation factor RimM
MDVDSENVDFIEKLDKEVYACGGITDLDLQIKIEKLDEKRNIKTEVFDEKNIMPSQIIREKRKNEEISNLENENKKIKQEFVEFEEKDDKEEHQEIKGIRIEIDESNNQVINKNVFFKSFLIFCIP